MRLGPALLLLLCLLAGTEGHWGRRKPIYSRRMSKSKMGRQYYGYASRYPWHHCHKQQEREKLQEKEEREERERKKEDSDGQKLCSNYLALPNGSFVGKFKCPFLDDEDKSWTKCCGYENEQFCCDPSYDDSWAHEGRFWILMAASALTLLVSCVLISVLLFLCWRAKKRAKVTSSAVDVKFSKNPARPAPDAPLPEKLHPDADPSFGMQNPAFAAPFSAYTPPPHRAMPPGYTETAEPDGSHAAAAAHSQPPPAYSVDTQ